MVTKDPLKQIQDKDLLKQIRESRYIIDYHGKKVPVWFFVQISKDGWLSMEISQNTGKVIRGSLTEWVQGSKAVSGFIYPETALFYKTYSKTIQDLEIPPMFRSLQK